MHILEYPAGKTAREWGQIHGETFRQDIHEISSIRTDLTVNVGGFKDTAQVFEIAHAHLPVLQRFDANLHAELLGISEGSGVAPEKIIVLNHYTDLRDMGPHGGKSAPPEDDCSAVLLRAPVTALLAQTWDMHGSAEPYVMMLHIPKDGPHPEAWLLSITGCLGMTGMNSMGLAVTINNLHSVDARIGVVWPALVRRILQQEEPESARDIILTAPLGSGHHYVVATGRHGFALETSGRRRKVVYDSNNAWYIHTNHCIDEELHALNPIPEGSSTLKRYKTMQETLANLTLPTSRVAVWNLLARVNQNEATEMNPHAIATCGSIVMDLKKNRLWAGHGMIYREDLPEPYLFEGQEPLE